MTMSVPASMASSASSSDLTSTSINKLNPETFRTASIAPLMDPYPPIDRMSRLPQLRVDLDVPVDQTWLSLSMTMLDKSCLWASIPPTSIPYFSTNRNPGVVFRVPAIMPLYPFARAMSKNLLDLWEGSEWRYRFVRWRNAHFVAMPLHRASRLRATRSPSSRCRALPRTVATFLTGWNVSPSCMCHSTLQRGAPTIVNDSGPFRKLRNNLRAPKLSKNLVYERDTRKDGHILAFPKEKRFSLRFAHDVPTVVKRGRVFC